MASQKRPGIRQSKLVLLVALAVGLRLLSPTSCHVQRQPPPGMVRVYHYTGWHGYQQIISSGHIRPSEIRQGDATYGTAVYATQLPPSTPVFTVLQNNYGMDGGIMGTGKDLSHRANYVFAFDLPREFVNFIEAEGNRSVLCIGGGENLPLHRCIYAGSADRAVHTLRVYHYTDKQGYDGILGSGHIRPSAFVGQESGVYVTELPPSTPFFTILENNSGQEKCMKGRGEELMCRADYVFVIDVPVDSAESINFEGNRSILRIGGGSPVPVQSTTYHGEVGQVLGLTRWMQNLTSYVGVGLERELMWECGRVPCTSANEFIKSAFCMQSFWKGNSMD